MDKLDKNLLERVEKALKLKLKEWQVNYILDIPMVLDMSITGRQTGKTLAYIIKLLFTSDTPIKAYDMDIIAFISDDYHVTRWDNRPKDNHYNQWFRGYLLEIHKCLTLAGVETRPVFYSELENKQYERERKIENE